MTALAAAYDRIADDYDDLHTSPAALSEDEWLARDMAEHVYGDVVDVGSGDGLLLRLLSVPASHYVGVDLSERMVLYGRWRHPDHRFIVGDMHHLAEYLPRRSADSVVCLFTFSMAEAGRLLSAVADVIRPGGALYFTVTTPLHAASDCPCRTYHPPDSETFYTEAEARALFSNYFHGVDVRPLPSDGQAGHYLIVTADGRFYRHPNDEVPWHGAGGPPRSQHFIRWPIREWPE